MYLEENEDAGQQTKRKRLRGSTPSPGGRAPPARGSVGDSKCRQVTTGSAQGAATTLSVISRPLIWSKQGTFWFRGEQK